MKTILSVFVFAYSMMSHAAQPIWKDPKSFPSHRVFSFFDETPLFETRQSYLQANPLGVNAVAVRGLPGGHGENVKIVDIETGMNANHEDLTTFWIGNLPEDSDHGTAVMGILGGRQNSFGITGIAPLASLGFYGFIEGNQDVVDDPYMTGILRAITEATLQLEAGDVLVIEQHMLGPDQNKWTTVEYWDPIYEALKVATDKGIHCVAAAGNGASNLDAAAYERKFDVTFRDSGCVIVGAGRSQSLQVLGFSNYGSRVDAFGIGENVTTTGYGDLYSRGNGGIHNYTGYFNGTSSATPVVAGAIALVSSIAESQGKVVSPRQMREALRNTGAPQNGSPSRRIGNLPDTAAMLQYLGL
jgi:serine protease